MNVVLDTNVLVSRVVGVGRIYKHRPCAAAQDLPIIRVEPAARGDAKKHLSFLGFFRNYRCSKKGITSLCSVIPFFATGILANVFFG